MMSDTVKTILSFIIKFILQAICREVGSCKDCSPS